MARQARPSGQNNFSGGLITEATALSFPPNACTETFDCVFDETGRVTRRLGFELEEGDEPVTATITAGEAYSEFLWQSVSELGETTFVVQQKGNILYFFDTSTSNTVSANDTGLTIDLDSHIATDSPRDPADFVCHYASGIGNLLVVNRACEPIYITYNSQSDTLTATEILVQQRDFDGADDGLDLTERVTATFSGLGSSNPEHYYNILNQGWHSGDSVTQWDTARTDMPSNADTVSLYRSSETDAFDNVRVTANSPGNTTAPKGHFILTAWDLDRTTAMTDEGYTDATIGETEVFVGEGVGTPFERHLTSLYEEGSGSSLSKLFDGITDTNDSSLSGSYFRWVYNFRTFVSGPSSALTASAGKDFSSAPIRVSKAVVYGNNNGSGAHDGFSYCYSVSDTPFQTNTYNITLTLRASSTAPTNANFSSHGTSLGSESFTEAPGSNESTGREITSSDTTTYYNYVWVVLSVSNWDDNFGRALIMTEIEFYTKQNAQEETYTIERPQAVEFFAGRAWYAGIYASGRGNKIYFSQIVEKPEFFGSCYQLNDPTSEDFTDFLPTDGGVIRIPEMGGVKRLFAYQNSLLVFATNGVWQITGANNNQFLPTDYVPRRLSNVGTLSEKSFASVKGVPIWWAEDGIYSVKYDPNYGSFDVINITDNKIASLVLDIPENNRQYVKATYDTKNSIVYFLYNDDDDITDDPYVYNRVLCLNSISGAWYPWTITEHDDASKVRGVLYVIDGSGASERKIKFTTTTSTTLNFAETRGTTYIDWPSTLDDSEGDYSSYFITGYSLDGDAQRFFQPNYIWVYLEHQEFSSCFVQAIFDFTTSGDSGKWSSKQQIFNPFLEHRSINHRRLKLRGKGKALQLKFQSERGKPFTIIGWSLFETINATP